MEWKVAPVHNPLKRTKPMDKNTLFSSFGKWLAPICTKTFIDRVTEIGQDKYVKKLTTLAYFKLFLHAQLKGSDGLREIADDVLCEKFQRELGLGSISASQLSRKHNQVDPGILEKVFSTLVQHICSQASLSSSRKKVKIIDSTTIALCLQKYKWATFRKSKAGIKVHTRIAFVNEHDVVPDKITITPARVNDRTQMDGLIDEEGITYVFDRGYVDYAAYDDYCENGIFFVTRLKKNAVIEPLHTYELPEDSVVSLDEKVQVGTQQKRMKHSLRMIQTQDSEGNLLFLLTNRFDLSADEIGEMYRSRWAIETFFKWMKQHVKIKTFYGTSEKAVMNQVWIALIAYCLITLIKQESEVKHSLLQIYRWLKVFLWQSYDAWFERMKRRPSRTSAGRKKKRDPVHVIV
jgi:hypothetical protein